MRLVIGKGAERKPERHYGGGRWGLKAWNYAKQVSDQDEQEERSQIRRESLAIVTNDVVALAFNESLKPLEYVLKPARTFDRKPGAQHDEKQHQPTKKEHFHRHRIGDRSLRVRGLNAE